MLFTIGSLCIEARWREVITDPASFIPADPSHTQSYYAQGPDGQVIDVSGSTGVGNDGSALTTFHRSIGGRSRFGMVGLKLSRHRSGVTSITG
jgi:hypothetical protein